MATQMDTCFQVIHSLAGYAAEVETLVLSTHGHQLTASQLADARLVGVRDPDRIRLATSFAILEDDPRYTVFRTFVSALAGLTIGHAIILSSGHAKNREVLLHECAHVAQYERLELRGFLQRYFAEYERDGCTNMPLEQEAHAAVRQALQTSPGRLLKKVVDATSSSRSPAASGGDAASTSPRTRSSTAA